MLASAAALAIKLFRSMKGKYDGESRMENLKGQAATIAAFAKAFFDILNALSTSKLPVTVITTNTGSSPLRDAGGYPRLSIGGASALMSGGITGS